MKCWECKKEIKHATVVCYIDYEYKHEKARDICDECEPKLKYTPCHFVVVERITQRSLHIGHRNIKKVFTDITIDKKGKVVRTK